MTLISKLTGICAAALMAINALPAAAQQQEPQPQQTQPQRPQFVTQFDNTTVTYLLQDVRATWRTEASVDGFTLYRASAEDGINFSLSPRAC